jgi:carboxyl-terminal processing protease
MLQLTLSEANLERHLETPADIARARAAEDARAKEKDGAKPGDKPPAGTNTQGTTQPQAPRFEFGSAEDFQLAQAMNHLKGQPVIASAKALSAQAKPQ